MHADIAAELQQHPAANTAAQQRLVDEWVRKFNYVRPHEALGAAWRATTTMLMI